jgi:cell division protein FtsB
LVQDALDLINRQKAEIERLSHIRAELSKEIDKLRDMVAQNEGVLPRYE